MQKAIKLPGELQRSEYKDFLKINPAIREYFEKRERFDERRLKMGKEARISMEGEIRAKMAVMEKRFMRK